MWLPAFNKIRRINSNRMNDSFMGSDLSYEDLNSRVLSDNNYDRLNDELFNGLDCYVLNVISRPDCEKEIVMLQKSGTNALIIFVFFSKFQLKKLIK